jgi:hypothetical protein
MRDRVGALGGSLHFEPERETGACVTGAVPLVSGPVRPDRPELP